MAILGYPSKRFSALALFPSTARVHATRKKNPTLIGLCGGKNGRVFLDA